jgi:hypothetical protein
LKEGVAKEASDAVAGGSVPKKGRRFSSVVRTCRKATSFAVSLSLDL